MRVYVDNAATTQMSEKSIEAVTNAMKNDYGNPSSLHTTGQLAAEKLYDARERLAKIIGAKPEEIYFTSGGSEADNQAIRSAALLGERKGKKHLISTTIEHHAVLHTLQRLEKEGFEVTYLEVGERGVIDLKDLEEAIREDTALVTIMFANNEIGTIQPVKKIGEICKEKGVLFHTDAVQALGHIKLNVVEDNIDMLSLSAHKFHGPKGVGALYARKGVRILPLIDGGAQEKGKRAGTENLPAIIGMVVALEEVTENMEEDNKKVSAMRDKLIAGLQKIPYSRLNGDKVHRLPGVVNFIFEGIEGESLLLLLDQRGIEASSGSACTSGSLDPSHVLMSLGLPHAVAHGSLRLSLSDYNTEEEVDYIIEQVPEVVTYLREISPVWEHNVKNNEFFLEERSI